VLSAKNRKATWEGEVVFEDMLQTDAGINPGNSGGALINLDGKLIGINTAMVAEAQSIGFAIPVKRVRQMLSELLTPEKNKGIWFGARVAERNGRLEVSSVQRGSPADKAGLKVGDVVTELDGSLVRGLVDFDGRLLRKTAGQSLTIGYTRGSANGLAKMTLAPMPKIPGAELAWAKLGLRLQPLTADLAGALGVAAGQGMVVTEVEQRSPAWDAGLRRGLVVARIGGLDIRGENELAAALAEVEPGDTVTVTVFSAVRRGMFVMHNVDTARLKAR
jgi:S1-C subfamily serine protease